MLSTLLCFSYARTIAPKVGKEMGYVNFETWTAKYCDRMYRAIGKEVSNLVSVHHLKSIF